MAITRNPGFVFLMNELLMNVKLVAPNTIKNRIKHEYIELVLKRKEQFAQVRSTKPELQPNGVDLDFFIYHRLFSLQYDCWTNSSSEAFLGLTVFFINELWQQQRVCLGCIPFAGRHTAEKTLILIEEVTYLI